MRIAMKDMRMVTLRMPEETGDGAVYRWLPGGTRAGVKIQPTGFIKDNQIQAAARLYGEIPEKGRVIYYAGIAELKEGMGVCVDAGANDPCDYRITGVEDWPGHRRAYLAYIPENRRE